MQPQRLLQTAPGARLRLLCRRPGEQVDAAAYPWGWETPGFDDSAWNKAQAGMTGGAKGARDYPGRLLVPTPIPPMENRTERFAEVRRSDGVRIPEGFPAGPRR